MTKLRQSDNLKYKNKPVIWMQSDIKVQSNYQIKEEPKKAILVATWENRSIGYTNEKLPSKMKILQKSFNETLFYHATAKGIDTSNIELISLKSKNEIPSYQKYFSQELPHFDGDTLVIEDVNLFQDILKFNDVEQDIKLTPTSKTNITKKIKRQGSFDYSAPHSSYTITTSNLQMANQQENQEIEFLGLDNIKWQRIENTGKVQFNSSNTQQIASIVTQIYRKVYGDTKSRETKSNPPFQNEFDKMLENCTAYSLICSENMLKNLFEIKSNKFDQMHTFSMFKKQQEVLSQLIEQKKLPMSVTPDMVKILKTQTSINNTNHNHFLFKFEKMRNSIIWYFTGPQLFTVGSESEINEICTEIIDKIQNTYISAVERDNHISNLYTSIQKQKDNTLKLEFNYHVLQTLFGKPKILTVKPRISEASVKNEMTKITPEIFRKTVLDKIFNDLSTIFSKSQLLEIFYKICNPNECSADDLFNYIKTNASEKHHDDLHLFVSTLKQLTSGIYSNSIELDKHAIISETYDFLNATINNLQSELRAEKSFKKIREKFYQPDKASFALLSFYNSPIDTNSSSVKRKFDEENENSKNSRIKLTRSFSQTLEDKENNSNVSDPTVFPPEEENPQAIEDFVNSILN